MNLIQGKTNQFLREAILENNVEKARKYLTLLIGKADVQGTTEQGGFTMLHCAVIIGNIQMVVMLLQLNANIWAITDDGYSALDLALWKGHAQIVDILRSQGAIAPMKEPESLNGKMVLHRGRKGVVVDYFPSTAFRTKSTRALHYPAAENGKAAADNFLVNLWAGTDYRIIGEVLYYEKHRSNVFTPMDVGMDADDIHVSNDQRSLSGSEPTFQAAAPRTPPVAAAASFPSDAETKLEAELETVMEGHAFFDLDEEDDDTDEDVDDDEIEVEATAEVVVPPGPLGVLLDSGIESCAVVQGFTPIVTGGPGAIEASGVVKPGMYIIGINDTNACLMTLQQVIQLLGKLARKEKLIRFAAYKPPKLRHLVMRVLRVVGVVVGAMMAVASSAQTCKAPNEILRADGAQCECVKDFLGINCRQCRTERACNTLDKNSHCAVGLAYSSSMKAKTYSCVLSETLQAVFNDGAMGLACDTTAQTCTMSVYKSATGPQGQHAIDCNMKECSFNGTTVSCASLTCTCTDLCSSISKQPVSLVAISDTTLKVNIEGSPLPLEGTCSASSCEQTKVMEELAGGDSASLPPPPPQTYSKALIVSLTVVLVLLGASGLFVCCFYAMYMSKVRAAAAPSPSSLEDPLDHMPPNSPANIFSFADICCVATNPHHDQPNLPSIFRRSGPCIHPPKTLLHDIRGSICRGQVLGLMGPSGSGKTTLLNALAGVSNGNTQFSGAISLDHEPLPANYRHLAAYVHQDDCLFPTLTVRESIEYSAFLRLPAMLSLYAKQQLVSKVLHELHLTHVADSRIGNATAIRGISGGERRRVSIAMELVTQPQLQVLFLRTLRNTFRQKSLFVLHVGISVFLGVVTGLIFMGLEDNLAGFQNRMGAFFFTLTFFGFGTLSSMDAFIAERPLFVKEAGAKYYSAWSYYVAKASIDLASLRVLPAIIFASIFYYLMGLNAPLDRFLLFTTTLVLFNVAVGSMSTFVSIGSKTVGIANLVATVVLLQNVLFGGFLLNVQTMSPGAAWMQWLSMFKYAFEVMMTNELSGLLLTFDASGYVSVPVYGEVYLKTLGMDIANQMRDVVLLVVIAAVFNVASFALLHFQVPRPMKWSVQDTAKAV
ncbi:hypothetical protein DYB37_007692 [Aphanomyces astaci]|uniref:ABC transporter domain-containing protein n=1 Tax=Aphanomyces astaci TaxID=112090 RepID=A0A3R7AZZ9_APHAT|nr:hypothetical protein DYB37_007692 [Aphanomyces astaci]